MFYDIVIPADIKTKTCTRQGPRPHSYRCALLNSISFSQITFSVEIDGLEFK